MYQPKNYSTPECNIWNLLPEEVFTLTQSSQYDPSNANNQVYDAGEWFQSVSE